MARTNYKRRIKKLNLETDVEDLEEYMKTMCNVEKACIIESYKDSEKVLEVLTKDPEYTIRLWVAQKTTVRRILNILVDDPLESVSSMAKKRLSDMNKMSIY